MNCFRWILPACLLINPAFGEVASLGAQVTDESGAIVPGAIVKLSGAQSFSRSATVANDGSYAFVEIPPGDYTVTAAAPQLAVRQPVRVSLRSGARALNLVLNIASEKQ